MANEEYRDIAIVLVDTISVRESPSDTAKQLYTMPKGSELTVYDRSPDGKWILYGGGWCKIQDTRGPLLQLKHPDGLGGYSDINIENEEKDQADSEDKEQSFLEGLGYTSDSLNAPAGAKKDSDDMETNDYTKLMVNSCRGIHGLPYQYMPEVDMRIDNGDYGAEYTSRIMANMPMLLITPGAPKFMKGYKSADKDSILKGLLEENTDVLQELMSGKDGKLYSFEFKYSDYYKIVNPLCRQMAIYMGIENETIDDGKPLSRYDWSNYSRTSLQGFVSNKESIAFYIDSETQISDSFSNDTQQSTLASSINGLSDMGREMQFLLGSGGVEFDMLKKENYDASLKKLDQWTSSFSKLAGNGIMDKLKEGFLTIATGGKMAFPEIWNDSNLGRSYDVTIKLRSPDADPFSLSMNILFPLAHILGLCGAQQMGANGYKSPFLIRAYYKGFFNIDMGIITSATINKGDKGKWTVNGVPTSVDVQLNIKDLYSSFFLSTDDSLLNTLKNTAQLDYVANLCGINVNKVDIARAIDLKFNTLGNLIGNKLTANNFMDITQYASNFMNNAYGSLK